MLKKISLTNLNKYTYFFLSTSFIITFFRFLSMPFLTIFLSYTTYFSTAQIGLIIGIPGLIQLILGVIASNIIDYFSDKFSIILSILLPACGMLGYIFFDSYVLMLFSSVVCGIGWSIYNPLLMSCLMRYSNGNSDIIIEINYWIINLSGAIGPLVGALLSDGKSEFPFFLFSGALFFLAISTLILFPYKRKKKLLEEKQDSPQLSAVIENLKNDILILCKSKASLFLFFSFFSINFIEAQYNTNFALHLTEVTKDGPNALASMMIAMTATILILQPISIKISKFVKLNVQLIIGSIFYTVGILIFGFSFSVSIFILSAILLAIGELIIAPKIQVLTGKSAPEELQTTAFAFTTMGGNLAFFLGPTLGGLLYEESFRSIFIPFIVIIGISTGITAMVANIYYKKHNTSA
ncbi:Multidrug resistance protein B [Marinilactibacillus psychrotolerans 42ea]|uniref:Multidrug resistance protein B n=1 Tax=Marinilactibacillus psychrotolerans 42ea TaxID=1255609 RepID=A0A1R4JX93_9LACT|nr:Multidrug resistance protein B [Marinilactibacillus psychrotolerans 42ea]